MGEVKDKFLISNVFAGEKLEIYALVDTGAVLPLIGRDIIEKLKFKPIKRVIVETINGQKEELDMVSPVSFEYGDRLCACNVLVGDYGIEPMIGQVVLEQMDLWVNCTERKLQFNPNSPAYPLLKMK